MVRQRLLYRGAVYERVSATEGDRYRLLHFNEPSYTTTVEDLEAYDDDPSVREGPTYRDHPVVKERDPSSSSWAEPWWKTPYRGPYPAATYRGLNFRMSAGVQDQQDRLLARKIANQVMLLSEKAPSDVAGWEQRSVDGLDVWVKNISQLLGTDIPAEVHVSNNGYMDKVFGGWSSVHGANAGTAIKDDTILVVLPIVESASGRVRKLDKDDQQEFLHEFVHAIDYTRNFDEIAAEKHSPYSVQSPRELKAYFLSMADHVEQYIEKTIAREKEHPVYFDLAFVEKQGPAKAAHWFWKNQVGWTGSPSFKEMCYDNFISPRWLYYLSDANKDAVDKRLDDLWDYLEQKYGSPQNPTATLKAVQ